jgi:hypothetical protein
LGQFVEETSKNRVLQNTLKMNAGCIFTQMLSQTRFFAMGQLKAVGGFVEETSKPSGEGWAKVMAAAGKASSKGRSEAAIHSTLSQPPRFSLNPLSTPPCYTPPSFASRTTANGTLRI